MESMLRRQLKEWQKAFRDKHAREPSKKDIQKHPEIASVYDTWHAIRGASSNSGGSKERATASSSSSSKAASSSDAHPRPSKKPRTESSHASGPPSTPTRKAQRATARPHQGAKVSDSFAPKLNPFKTPTKAKAPGAKPSTTTGQGATPTKSPFANLTPRQARSNPLATPTKPSSASRSNASTPGSARSIVIVPQSPIRRLTRQGSMGSEDGERFDYAPSPSRLRDLISSHARYSPNTRQRRSDGTGGATKTWGLGRGEDDEALLNALTPRSKARKRLKGEPVPPTPLARSTRENKDRLGGFKAAKSRGSGKLSFGAANLVESQEREGTDSGADDGAVLDGASQAPGATQGRLSSFMRSISAVRAAQLQASSSQANGASDGAKSRMMDEDQDEDGEEDLDEIGPSPSREKSRVAAKAKFASLFDSDTAGEAGEEPVERRHAAQASSSPSSGPADGDSEDDFGDSLPLDSQMLGAAEAEALEAAEREEREAARRKREERRKMREGENRTLEVDGFGEEAEAKGVTLRAYRLFERTASSQSTTSGMKVDDAAHGLSEEEEDEDDDDHDIVSFALRRSPAKAVKLEAGLSTSHVAILDVGPSTAPSADDGSPSTQAMLDSTLRLWLTSPKGGRARQLKAKRDEERLRLILGDERSLEALRLEDEMRDDEDEGSKYGKGKGKAGAAGNGSKSWGEAKFKERLAASMSTDAKDGKSKVKLSKKEMKKLEAERAREEEERKRLERLKPMRRSARAGVADDEDEERGAGREAEEWSEFEVEGGGQGGKGRRGEEDSDWESGVEESDEEYGLGGGEMDLDDVE